MKLSSNRFMLTSFAIQLGLPILVLGSMSAVHALPTQETTTTYFSDSSKTTEVGEVIRTCNAQTASWGKITRFFLRSSSPCESGPQTPETQPLPCEFLLRGCSPFPSRDDGHFY